MGAFPRKFAPAKISCYTVSEHAAAVQLVSALEEFLCILFFPMECLYKISVLEKCIVFQQWPSLYKLLKELAMDCNDHVMYVPCDIAQ